MVGSTHDFTFPNLPTLQQIFQEFAQAWNGTDTITHHINGKRNRREAAVPGVSGRSLLLGAPENIT